MRMAQPDWPALALFSGIVLTVAVFGLAVSGHFPREHRRQHFRRGIGAIILWASVIVSCIAAASALRIALLKLPGYAAVIAGGAALLLAPIVLKPLPDSLVDGKAVLLLLAISAATLAAAAQWL